MIFFFIYLTFFDVFHFFGVLYGFLWPVWVFLLDFFGIFFTFFLLLRFWNFLLFIWFFWIFWIVFKATMVTTKSYEGLLLNTKNKQKQRKLKLYFAQRAKKYQAKGRSPPQELEESARSGLYLLVWFKSLRPGLHWFDRHNLSYHISHITYI